MNQAFDLLLLLFNLSQLHNREKIIQLFVEGMQEIFKPAEFKYIGQKEPGPGIVYEIRTRKSSFGYMNAILPSTGDNAGNILINNAVQMLAVSLENLDFEQKLEKERNQFEKISINKLAEVEKNIKDLEEVKRASLNLIEDLSDEIEKRKNAEKLISDSEQKFRNLFEHSPVGKSITGVDGSINVNKSFCNILGYSEDELKAKNWRDISHPDDIQATDLIMKSLIAGESEAARFEKRYIHKNGNAVYTDVSSYLQRDNNGNPEYFITTINDITDRKLAEELVLQEKKFNQAAIDSLPGLFYLFDEQGHYLRWNKNYEEVSGYSAEEIAEMSPLDYFMEPDKSEIATAIQQVWTTGNTLVEGKFTSKNRTQKHYLFTGKLFWFEGKRCLIGMGIDITDLKNAEEGLRKLNAVLEQRVLERTNLLARSNNLLVETGRLARVGGWEIDLKTGKNYWSEATYKIHEVEPGFEPDTNTAINFYAPESIPIISECVDRLISLGEPFDKELEIITAKKNRIWVRAIGEAYRENGKIVKIGGVFQDINDRKLTEEELKRRSVQLEASNKELEAFSYSVSHDLRAPLRAINSFTNILLEDYENTLDEEGKRICGIISSSATQMGELIDDLLSFSRIGRSTVKFGMLDMKSLANSVINEIFGEKSKDRINLKLGKLSKAYGDTNLIRIVWTNLISNAIKYSSHEPSSEIVISSRREDHTVTYSVKDNGVGFDMQYVHKLFGVFQRLHSEKDFEGNGVGLATVQRIINKHGGRVWAEGEVDKGATFYFSLPASEEREKGRGGDLET